MRARSQYMPTNEQKKDFGLALKAARVQAGMTQTRLGEAVGQHGQTTVQGWEAGVNTPQEFAVVFALEEALGLRPGELARHLGFQPVSSDCPPCDVVAAIRNDPSISDDAKATLMGAYRAALPQLRRRRG